VIDRRTFLVGWASVLATPFVAETQERKAAKIGFLLGGTLSTPSVQIEPFKQTLHEKGWIEGKNLTLEYRPAEGHYERLPALVRELVVGGVDVIVTDGTPQTRATIEVTKTIPVVMATTGDPVASGLVSSLAHPGGNLTGASFFLPEINVKRLELLKEAAPHIARVAVVYNALNAADERAVVDIETVAKTLKLRIQRLAVHAPADFDAMFPLLTRQRVGRGHNSRRRTDSFLRASDRGSGVAGQGTDRGRLVESRGGWRLHVVRPKPPRTLAQGGAAHGQNPQGCEARRPPDRAAHEVRTGHQSEDGQGAWPHDPSLAPGASGSRH